MKKYLCVFITLFTAISASAAEPLKLGLLLIEDSVPFYVAEKEDFYKQQNIEVELIPFLSAIERDSALAAEAIDGAIDDPVGAILFDRGRDILKITSLCLGEKADEGVFAILAAPGSSIKTVTDLKNVEIAVSNATIIEYVTDRMLELQGFTQDEIKKIEVKKMPIRMQMLLSGSVQAATLPEPLATIAAGKGATILLDDSNSSESLSQTVIVFRTKVLQNRKEEVFRFFQAYKNAVQAINADPEKYRDLLVEKGRIPPFMAASYPIPTYPQPVPFSKDLYMPVITWLNSKQLVEPLPYRKMVATDFMSSSN